MNALDNAKAKIDTNHDGKVSIDELERLRNGKNGDAINRLQAIARRYDGRVNIKGIERTLMKI